VKSQTGSFLRALPEVDERRQHQRVEVEGATIEAFLPRETITLAIDNLSEGGALIAGRIEVELGSSVEMRVHLPGIAAITLTARVLRHVPRGGKDCSAVMFLTSSDLLAHWITELVLQGLRAAFPEL
jgi:hypothetical protein